jgi:DNA-binding NarL/FixJ family response regulator
MVLRLVVVDDHVLVCAGLRALLDQESDFEVVGEARDGCQALDLVRQVQPDVVVMDLSMPRLSGIEATRQLRVDTPLSKVVALSQHADPRFVDSAFQAGATGYVIKEEVYGELVRAIRAVAAGQVYLSPALAERVGAANLQLPATQPVAITLEAPDAQTVFVSGSFNQWQPQPLQRMPDKKGWWLLTLALAPGTYQYRFKVGDQWRISASTEQIANADGADNNVICIA